MLFKKKSKNGKAYFELKLIFISLFSYKIHSVLIIKHVFGRYPACTLGNIYEVMVFLFMDGPDIKFA